MAGLAPMCFFNNTMNEVRNVVYLIHLILMYGLEWCFTYVYIYCYKYLYIFWAEGGRWTLDHIDIVQDICIYTYILYIILSPICQSSTSLPI